MVDFNGAPISFLCKDQLERYYLALCYNMAEWEYLVVRLSDVHVFHLLHQEISMRETILEQPQYWLVTTGENPHKDQITQHEMADIDTTILPEEDTYFQVLTQEMREYVEKFDKTFFLHTRG